MNARRTDPKRADAEPRVPERARRTGARREEILTVATKLFADHGYDGASMEALAKNVGLRKASLFHHFPSKDALYAEVLGTLLKDVGQHLDAAGGASAPYLARLTAFADAVVTTFGSRPHAGKLLFREAMDRGPVMKKWLGKQIAELLARGLLLGEEGKRLGHFADMDAKNMIISLIGVFLVPYAIEDVVRDFQGAEPSEGSLALRKQAVRAQLLALAGPAAGSGATSGEGKGSGVGSAGGGAPRP